MKSSGQDLPGILDNIFNLLWGDRKKIIKFWARVITFLKWLHVNKQDGFIHDRMFQITNFDNKEIRKHIHHLVESSQRSWNEASP